MAKVKSSKKKTQKETSKKLSPVKAQQGITVTKGDIQDDGGFSETVKNNIMTPDESVNVTGNTYKDIFRSVGLYSRSEIRNAIHTKTFRFGYRDPYGALFQGREYLFFTRPDLHIIQVDEAYKKVKKETVKATSNSPLNIGLQNIPYWVELYNSRATTTISSLQMSYLHKDDPFNHLLQNQVTSNLEIPELSAETIDTPVNDYGVGYSYRGSSESSDNGPEFSLEFKDNKYLDTYYFFKTYEEYETLKHHGVVRPALQYIQEKVIHDQFAIYKFIVDEDMETIIYYGKMYGVMPKSLPRDVFTNPTFDNGLSYSISFKAAFYEEMKPEILSDFNELSAALYNKQKYQINPYNIVLGHADMRMAKAAAVVKDTTSATAQMSPAGYVYKLKWRGGDQ